MPSWSGAEKRPTEHIGSSQEDKRTHDFSITLITAHDYGFSCFYCLKTSRTQKGKFQGQFLLLHTLSMLDSFVI